MILNSVNNNFIFNFDKNWIYKSIKDKYNLYLNKLPIPYQDITDYLNATIQSVNFPSPNLGTVTQTLKYGKTKNWKNSINPNDLFSKEFTVTLKHEDGYLNYWIMFEQFNRFVDFQNKDEFLPDLSLHILDSYGNIVITAYMQEVIMTGFSDLSLSYSDNNPEFKTFDLNFTFNYLNIKLQ